MPKKIIKPKVKVKVKPVVKRKTARKLAYDPTLTHVIAAVGNRNLQVRQGADGLELETTYGDDNHHLATLVFASGEAGKLRDVLAALVR
jgi:hypothetical protein